MSDPQVSLTLLKIVPMEDHVSWHYSSALWGIQELPSIQLRRRRTLSRGSFWQVQHWPPLSLADSQDRAKVLSARVCNKLRGQRFPNRRDTLQAVEMALLLAQSGEEDEE